MTTVTVYSTESCPWCHKVKEFLEEHKIAFTNKDVGTNQAAAKEMVEKSKQMGVPVTDIDGHIVVGFNEEKLREVLGVGD